MIKGKVLEADPYTLKYTWTTPGGPIESLVTWTLKQEGGQTFLTLVHSGISQYGDSAAQVMEQFEMGWNACLSALPDFLKNEESEPAH